MPTSLALAIGDLADRRVQAIFGRSLLWTLAIFAALGALVPWALWNADPCAVLGFSSCTTSSLFIGFSTVALILFAMYFLFPAVAIGVISNYADAVVAAIEARHYPQAAIGARRLGMTGSAWFGLRQSLRILLYNLIALPFYIALLITGVGPLILFVLVNGLAIATDLGAMVATRHTTRDGRYLWLRRTRGPRIAIGLATGALLMVPILNLLAPILGAAAMAHLYQRTAR